MEKKPLDPQLVIALNKKLCLTFQFEFLEVGTENSDAMENGALLESQKDVGKTQYNCGLPNSRKRELIRHGTTDGI
jgi:hypothetical protein